MAHLVRVACGVVLIAAFAGGALAAETKEEKLTADQTQAQYQRKSITYLGMLLGSGVSMADDQYNLVEKILRTKFELPRFDYNAINLGTVYTIDQMVAELREYVKKLAVDRASADAQFEARFKSARIYAKDIERIMSSAFLYNLNVLVYSVSRSTCPDDKLTALALGCVPGTQGMLATVNATATFYNANLLDETKPPYRLLKTVQNSTPTKSFVAFKEIPQNPDQWAIVEKNTGLQATTSATDFMGDLLSKEMKKIPEFQLLTPVVGALSDGVEFMLGKAEGVGFDETYDVSEFDPAGGKKIIGYVKVRKIGDAKGSGEGTPSYAEQVKVKSKFDAGNLLIEHPMVGFSVGVHLVGEFVSKDLLGKTDETTGEVTTGFYPGLGLYVDKDMANIVKIPEFYLSLEADFLMLGKTYDEVWDVNMAHAMLGLKKKWYMNSLVFALGLRGGISYFLLSADGVTYEDNSIGIGGDLWAGLEYYINPEFSLYAKFAGRFFTNPLQLWTTDADPEMGVNVAVGAFLAF